MTPDQAAALARDAWERGQAAHDGGDKAGAIAWLDRAQRLAPHDPTIRLSLATVVLRLDPARARTLFAALADRHDIRDIHLGLAAACHLLGDTDGARAALATALTRHAAPRDDGWVALADRIGPANWRALRPDPDAIRRVEGIVTWQDGRITGWAWHPANPGRPVTVTIRPASGADIRLRATRPMAEAPIATPLAQPRAFARRLDPADGPFHVIGDDDRPLPGSPIDPAALGRPCPAAPPPRAIPRQRGLAIVIPVHGNRDGTIACLSAVLATRSPGSRVIVVDDASPDPVLAAALDRFAAQHRIRLIRHTENRGFPAAANAGLAAAAGRDALLLNSDTLPPPDALTRLHRLAYAAPDIATVCPLSNNATILSYPSPANPAPMPDAAETARLAALAWRANGDRTVPIPTPVGFCMLIRHDALKAGMAATGPFRADLFGRGYGEENDLAERLLAAGWQHRAAPGLYVAHQGEASFGPLASALRARGTALLRALHPGYPARIAAHAEADTLQQARTRLDLARFRAARRKRAALLLTHGDGGGVEHVIKARQATLREEGLRPITLRPGPRPAMAWLEDDTTTYPNLCFRIPRDYPALLRLLRAERPGHLEIHNTLGHAPAILGLARDLAIPYQVRVHDHAWICPRVTLTRPDGTYCGEPDLPACETCRATHGSFLEPDEPVATLRRRAGRILRAAASVQVGSEENAIRLRRHFPRLHPTLAQLEDAGNLPPVQPAPANGPRHILVAGAIGEPKGFPLLLAAARDAAARRLPLRFTLVGHSIDDAALLATNRVFITGPYRASEAVALIRAQGADLALLPGQAAETWSFTLTELWRAGLPVAAFDIGAQAERIRATGRGMLFPIGLPAARVNDALLAARW